MQDNIITWNLPNWVSVVLMALFGFLALGTVVSLVKAKRKDGGQAQQTTQ